MIPYEASIFFSCSILTDLLKLRIINVTIILTLLLVLKTS